MPGRKRRTTDRVADTDVAVEARGIENGDAIAARIIARKNADTGDTMMIEKTMIGNATEVIVTDPDPDLVVGTTTNVARIHAQEVALVAKMRNIRGDDA
jgi:hypothetical protein